MFLRAHTGPLWRAAKQRPWLLPSFGLESTLSAVLALGIGVLPALGCGDGDPPPGLDAAVPDTHLSIVDDEDDLGLSYNERKTLVVRYENALGERLTGEPIEFALVATGIEEDSVGSTLSLATAITDGDGTASVDLVAGAENASFRVSVDARDAPTQFFYIEISDGGFARVRVTPVHDGWRPSESFSRVDVRLYRPSQVTCAALDIDAPPVSTSPARATDGFGGTVEYQAVAAGQSQVVVAWARVGSSTVRSAVGCVDIASGQLPPGLVEFAIVITDRPLLSDGTSVRTRFDLAEVVARARDLGAERPWQTLACAAGTGQLLLDCTLDALVADGELDCRPEANDPLALAIGARRGPVDMDGCRPATDGDGEPSLDQQLTLAVAAGGPFPSEPSLTTLLSARTDIAAGFTLDSQLATAPDGSIGGVGEGSIGEGGPMLEHALVTAGATLTTGESFVVDLAASSRPVVVQSPVVSTWQGPDASLAGHWFTVRYGQVAADAFTALGLQPAGVAERADTLGQLLAESVSAPPLSGCDALSTLMCTDIGQSSQCLRSACEQGAQVLDQRMTGWWRLMDVADSDFEISGTLTAVDNDGDRKIEAWTPPTAGAGPPWAAAMTLSDGTTVSAIGEVLPDAGEAP